MCKKTIRPRPQNRTDGLKGNLLQPVFPGCHVSSRQECRNKLTPKDPRRERAVGV